MTIDIVVADDLTGTADTLVQFLGCAGRTIVFPTLQRFERAVRQHALPAGDLAVGVNTESRHLPPQHAAARVRRAHRAAQRLSPRLLFQKVDSALRGNPGAEISAYRSVTGARRVLMTPAFLPSRRTVSGGVLYVNGVPLAQSEVAADVRTPMKESSVAALLAGQAPDTISALPARVVRGPAGAALDALRTAPPGIIVADAESPTDLAALARLVVAAGLEHAVSGSAGLAGRLGQLLPASPSPRAPVDVQYARRALVIFGSLHPTAGVQLCAAAREFAVAIWTLVAVTAHSGRLASDLNGLAADLTGGGRALLASPAPGEIGVLEPVAVAAALARSATRLVDRGLVDALVVSGGDVAGAVCRALGVEWIELLEQVFPGAPLGRINGGKAAGLVFVGKSGAHGADDGLITILRKLTGQPVRSNTTAGARGG